jgi:hypothetical protein
VVAGKARKCYDTAAKERMSEGGKKHGEGVENLPPLESSKARDAAGKALGVSGRSVDLDGDHVGVYCIEVSPRLTSELTTMWPRGARQRSNQALLDQRRKKDDTNPWWQSDHQDF